MNNYKLAIIIVTYNSEFVLRKNIESIIASHIDYEQLIIVDSGSDDKAYLNKYKSLEKTFIIYEDNVGFAKGNNIGFSHVKKDIEVVLFLNPDIIFEKNIIPKMVSLIRGNIVAVSPILKRYIVATNDRIKFTNDIDSSGIYSTWYGKYYDSNIERKGISYPEALCGAFILCNKEKMNKIIKNGEVFNESMFMYKEDVELGLRIKNAGYQFVIDGDSVVYHGRGWKSRDKVSKWQKKISARNDWYLLPYIKGIRKLWAIAYYSLKSCYVKYIE